MQKKKIAVALNLDWPIKRYHELFLGIQDYTKENTDWTLVWDHYPEKALKRLGSPPCYAGVIGRIKYKSYDEITRLNIPVINTWESNSLKNMTSIFPDYEKAGEIAAEHLIRKGFRNFANIDYRASTSATTFFKGFQKVIKPYGCSVKRYLTNNEAAASPILWDKFSSDFDEWVKDWQFPLGIVCSLSCIGPKVVSRCLANNLRIPEDIALITTGNDNSACEGFSPTISSVDMNFHKVGYESARLLDLKMKGEEISQKVTRIPPSACIARESTDSYAVDDKVIQKALRYISDNFHNNILVGDVVDATGISRTAVEKRFSNTIGHTIYFEINRLRVSSAKKLLIETELEINKIAKKCGFSSAHHCIRVFKKFEVITPLEYRLNNS